MEESKKSKEWKWWNFTFVSAIIIGLWAGSFWVINCFWQGDERGVIGDLFGAVNSLFSGLAFAGVVYAIYLQREDLKMQERRFSDQITIMWQTLEFEKHKVRIQSRPQFGWIDSNRPSPNVRKFRFTNKGGEFKIVYVNVFPEGPKSEFYPVHLLGSGEQGTITIKQSEPIELPQTFKLKIGCEGYNREQFDFEFEVSPAHSSPVLTKS